MAEGSEFDRQNKMALARFRAEPKKGAGLAKNWQDELKDANNPDSLADLYIKNLKEGE